MRCQRSRLARPWNSERLAGTCSLAGGSEAYLLLCQQNTGWRFKRDPFHVPGGMMCHVRSRKYRIRAAPYDGRGVGNAACLRLAGCARRPLAPLWRLRVIGHDARGMAPLSHHESEAARTVVGEKARQVLVNSTYRRCHLHLYALFCALLLSWATAHAEDKAVDLELVLAVDVSASVDDAEFALQMAGIAEAFRDQEVQAAIASGPLGRVAVSLVLWADPQGGRMATPLARSRLNRGC